MNILILTPDTDIDRRIILQANVLLEMGHKITIIGSPYDADNYLSGKIDERIQIKRINSADIKYDEKVVIWYYSSHKHVDEQAVKRNEFLNKFYNSFTKCINTQSKMKYLYILNNKITGLNIKSINYLTTKYFALKHRGINWIYRLILLYVRIFKINFFPNFDDAFYNMGIMEDADLVIANDLPSLYAANKISKEKNIPLIYDAHENYTEQCTLSTACVKRLEQVEAEILPQVDFWIVPNELLGKCMIDKYSQKYNKKIKDSIVIQNAINYWNEFDLHKDKDIIREQLSIGKNKKILLFQGGFLGKRNLENLVKSMKFVKNEDVILVMLGFGQFVEVLKKIVKVSNLDKKVFFMEAVSQSELLRYTCSADVGVIPYPAVDNNTYYCSPNKLYEYIQARLPILSNDLPFLRKVVIENRIGKVGDFSNPKLIANAIDDMFSFGTNIEEYRKNINEIARVYCWEEESKKLMERYNELVLNLEFNSIKESAATTYKS